VVAFRYPSGQLSRIRRLVRRLSLNPNRGEAYERTLVESHLPFSNDRSRHGAQILEQLPPWDILHLHWCRGRMLDYSEFFRHVPKDRRDRVWTLHDMHPFNRRLATSAATVRDSRSPVAVVSQLNSSNPRDFSAVSLARKRSGYRTLQPGKAQSGHAK